MSGPDSIIIYGAAAVLVSLTASRFLLQELIAVIILCKELKATIKGNTPDRRLDS
jgi:hypothetical protein